MTVVDFSTLLRDPVLRGHIQAAVLAEVFRDALSVRLVMREVADPVALAYAEHFGLGPDRLVVLGDVATRTTRVLTRREVQVEVADAISGRFWGGR